MGEQFDVMLGTVPQPQDSRHVLIFLSPCSGLSHRLNHHCRRAHLIYVFEWKWLEMRGAKKMCPSTFQGTLEARIFWLPEESHSYFRRLSAIG